MPRSGHHSDAAKPLTSGAKSEGPFGKQKFVHLPAENQQRQRERQQFVMRAKVLTTSKPRSFSITADPDMSSG
jgi:hypothetical protein